jgi:hypothetical protein
MACPAIIGLHAPHNAPSDRVPGPVARPALPRLLFVPEQTSCRNPVDQRIQDPDITHASPASRINKKRGVVLVYIQFVPTQKKFWDRATKKLKLFNAENSWFAFQ